MKYSSKSRLYLPNDLHAKVESGPNFPPKLSGDVVATGERVQSHDWVKHTYYRTPDDMPTYGSKP